MMQGPTCVDNKVGNGYSELTSGIFRMLQTHTPFLKQVDYLFLPHLSIQN